MHDYEHDLKVLRHMWHTAQEAAADAVQTLGTLTEELIAAEVSASRAKAAHTPALVIPPDLQQLIDDAPGPAYLIDRYYTVHAMNAAGYRLDGRSVVGHNAAWIGFEAARRGCIEEEHSLEFTVSGLRELLDEHPDDLGLHRLIRNLAQRFPRFEALWGRRRLRIGGCVIARPSPDGAELVFDYECQPAAVPGTDYRFAVGIPRDTRTRARLDRIVGEDSEGALGPPLPRVVA